MLIKIRAYRLLVKSKPLNLESLENLPKKPTTP